MARTTGGLTQGTEDSRPGQVGGSSVPGLCASPGTRLSCRYPWPGWSLRRCAWQCATVTRVVGGWRTPLRSAGLPQPQTLAQAWGRRSTPRTTDGVFVRLTALRLQAHDVVGSSFKV